MITQTTTASHDTDGNDERLVQAAWLYYVDGLTQEEIAHRLFVSRPTVGRMLQRARSNGIVRIEVDTTKLGDLQLANDLKQEYELDDVVVIPAGAESLSQEAQNDRVAAAASIYVSRHLHPGSVIGLAWGETVQQTLAHLPSRSLEGVTFAALGGGMDYINARLSTYPSVAERLRPIPAPLVVSSTRIAQALNREESVKATLDLARTAEMTLTSVGPASLSSNIARAGVFTPEEITQVISSGAVGDMLGQWFNGSGTPITSQRGPCHVGMSLEELRKQQNVVGLVAGRNKAEAARVALLAGYWNSLVTDERVARALLSPALART
ncbi:MULTISPECIES: sugar-binding transcriptional regulator [Actinomyces]|uniref:Rna polymerase sigma factor region 3/4 n=1 Tax=Actinomyces glycerinitolerans TaxID=1892869 RepID=A0A1M4RWN2_9ACTO|nr:MULTISPECIES: sugar-binding domain-containing protein [Actinomyces]RAX20465.1 hypothetical protein DRB07_13955 [Actinomyces sp. Z3]SHE24372.1 rna polymerase sigma factor region 3/4 [Actinomyces glycerinitolerans]